MRYDSDVHHRRSIRLPEYDYSQAGAYFVTICTHERVLLFDDKRFRNFVYNAWHSLLRRFPSLRLDEFVIMPNHVHGIVWILGRSVVGAQRDAKPKYVPAVDALPESEQIPASYQAAPLRPGVASRSLGAICRTFKSVSTKRINRLRGTPASPVWQRNYFERIIRNEGELNAIRQYIRDNPAKWSEDKNNPMNWQNEHTP
jgi:REP element-mobilizing transposase RayT